MRSARWQLLQIMLLIGSVLLVLIEPVAFALVLLLWAIVPVLALVFNATLLGTLWTAEISHRLARERLDNRHELVQLSTLGSLGSAWLLATAVSHRQDRLLTANRLVRIVAGFMMALFIVGIGFLLLSLVITPDSAIHRQNQSAWLQALLPFAAISILLWLDHVQSSLLALLCGLIAPTLLTHPTQARLLGALGYLTVQIATGVVALLGIASLQILTHAVLSPLLQTAFVCAWSVVLLYCLRESQLGFALRLVLWRYHLHPGDLWESIA